MALNPRLLVTAVLLVVLGTNGSVDAAAIEINAGVASGSLSVVDADQLWRDSVIQFHACRSAGNQMCLNAVIDPDQIVRGEAIIEFDSGRVFPPADVNAFVNGAGFRVRELNISGEQINTHQEALTILNGFQQAEVVSDSVGNFASVNFGGGTFGGDEIFPDGGPNDESREDYILSAQAPVTIPFGFWAIAFGSDDGGQLTLKGVEFEDRFNENNSPGNPDQVFYDANRPHEWTGGNFFVVADEGQDAELFASMHERSFDDSFEIAVCNMFESQCINDNAQTAVVSAANGWEILRDGALGWRIGTVNEQFGPLEFYSNRFVDDRPTLELEGTTKIQRAIEFTATGPVPEGRQTVIDYELYDGGITERSGVNPVGSSIVAVSLEVLHEESGRVITLTEAGANANFTVRLLNVSGETVDSHTEALALLENAQVDSISDNMGDYATINFGGGTFGGDERFPDGAPDDDSRDDYIMTARAPVTIPTGGWAIAFGSDDGGQLTLTGEDGEGIAFETTDNEDGPTGDPGQIFFNGNRPHGWTGGRFFLDRLTNADLFASMHERGGGDSFEVAICSLQQSESGCFINEDSSNVTEENGWVLLRDGAFGWRIGTEFDIVNRAEFNKLFAEVPIPVEIISGPTGAVTCEQIAATRIPGDADGNGEVAFGDFLALSVNFGTDAGYEGGDFDCNGEVAFFDFLTLANNFGAAAAVSIPEPSSLSLVCVGGLSCLASRRRRCCRC